MIGFNKPHLTGNEVRYLQDAVDLEKISGNGAFTKKCQLFFEQRYGFKKTLLTHSCTAALEMAALLLDIKPGDEVIMPSYTFVSTANAFVLRGAKIIFADSNPRNPNIDVSQLGSLISSRTKAIVVVHYGGVACDMDVIMQIAEQHGIYVVEDAAQAVESFYKNRPLGGIGHLAAFSFHETKNVISGEGGMLVINDPRFIDRAEIIWEKGTNRNAFFRGEVDKYTWMDIGSSFLPSELTAAFLYAQLEKLEFIQNRRKEIWNLYYDKLTMLADYKVCLPYVDKFATNNAHLFYIITKDIDERDTLLRFMNGRGVQAIFHYLPLHTSPFYQRIFGATKSLPEAERYGDQLIRLPMYVDLTDQDAAYVASCLTSFYQTNKV